VDACLGEADLVGYVDGTLGEAVRAAAAQHIDRCAGCRWLISELARTSLPTLSRSEPPGVPQAGRLRPGQRVGRYLVGEQVGGGAMGDVFVAYDPDLDRNVALKVVRSGLPAAEGARARLLIEARAMARLSHPGVVPIYDVRAAEGGDVILAMELIEGQDARSWLAADRPRWRTALAVLTQAGRGLSAAHAAGLVHRDVKPDNVLVGRDGRARLSDFGLVRAASRVSDGDAGAAIATSVAPAVTGVGVLVGTPTYMAPEQLRGQVADARSDQFSFCVLLYEALYGERPFLSTGAEPAGLAALTAEVNAGRVRSPPTGSTVPAWLRRILVRGLAVDPGKRWASMAELLDALAEVPRRRRRWLVAIAASAGVIAAVVLASRTPGETCEVARAALEQSFAPAAQADALARISRMGPYGASLSPDLGRQLEAHAASWLAGQRDACRDHRRGAQSADLLDRRTACLDRGRAALTAVGKVLGAVDERTLPDAVLAVRALPDPAACADLPGLLALPPPPRDRASHVAAIAGVIETTLVELEAGRTADAARDIAAQPDEARAVDYRPLLARALLARGRVRLAVDDRKGALPDLSEAAAVAIAAGDDALAVEAWARHAYVAATQNMTEPAVALAGLQLVEAMATRENVTAFARALLENNVGAVLLGRGDRDQARRRFLRAVDGARHVSGPGAVELVNARANLALVTEDPIERDAILASAEAALTGMVGAAHPETLRVRVRRGVVHPDLGVARTLLQPACDAYVRFHRVLAAAAVGCSTELAFVADELGDRPGAVAILERVAGMIAVGDRGTEEAAGYLLLWRGDARGAAASFAAAIADTPAGEDQPWWIGFRCGQLGVGLGRARRAAGDRSGARTALEPAIASLEKIQREHPSAVVDRRLARGRAELVSTLVSSPQRAEAAAVAAAMLQAEGGRADEIAELRRGAGR